MHATIESDTPGMSSREISTWASLIITILGAAFFFAATATGAVQGPAQIGLLIAVMVVEIIASILLHIYLAIRGRRAERPDERDALIDSRAYRNAYFVLIWTVMSAAVAYLGWAGIASAAADSGHPDAVTPPSVSLVGNAVLFCLVAAEIAKCATQVYLYRRGIAGAVEVALPIRNEIRRLRFENGEMTQEALAKRIGVTRQTVIAIEQARYSPTLELAFRIARAFNRPLGDVFQFEPKN